MPLSFSIMCAVDPAAAVLWQVTGVTPPLGGAIARGVRITMIIPLPQCSVTVNIECE